MTASTVLDFAPPSTRTIPMRAWVVGVLLLLCAVLANYMRPVPLNVAKPDLEVMIPTAFAGWTIDRSVVPILPSADVEANLNSVYDVLLSRTFINAKGERMMLSLGYTAQQGGKAKLHWQEICYRAQGFNVNGLTTTPARVAGRDVRVSRFVAQQRNRIEPVSYWLTLGDLVITDRYERFAHLLRLSLSRQTSDGFLVRVSSIDNVPPRAFDKQLAFMDELFAAMPPADVVRLAGRR